MKNNSKKPLILITNDDGDTANGIAVLTRLMMQIGEVIVLENCGTGESAII